MTARAARRALAYLLSHWRGEQSLARSFWINLVALRTAVFVAQRLLRPGEGDDHAEHALLVLALALLAHGVLFLWQVVGTLRAAETHLAASGFQAPVWGAQLGVALALWLTLTFALEGWQMTRPLPVEERFVERLERERAARYRLGVDESGARLLLRGSIEPGVTARVAGLLASTPTLDSVLLESPGGNVYEGRGLARLFREHGLATHVDGLCASACTIAFIGGRPRTIGPAARLGFHRYRMDADYAVIVTDAARAQRREQRLFAEAGVGEAFVRRMFDERAESMWWPTADELEAAGVVDRAAGPPHR